MPTQKYALRAIVNAIQDSLEDVQRVDIDNNNIGIRASKSYWIEEGWMTERWRDHGIPQVSILGLNNSIEGEDGKGARYERMYVEVDIFGSGRDQCQDLLGQIKKHFYDYENRESLRKSGVKFDSLYDNMIVQDEVLPQKIYSRQVYMNIFYRTSGA